MKALSIRQPQASAVALGSKRIETRSWKTQYRGVLAIHAAKAFRRYQLTGLHSSWSWCGALRGAGVVMGQPECLWDLLPFGAIVATCELVGIKRTEKLTLEVETVRIPEGERRGSVYGWTERQLGDYTPGRFAWILENVCRLSEPIPWQGQQGLFNVPDEVLWEALRKKVD